MVDYLQIHFTFFLIVVGVLGLCVGSFLNVVAHRLPIMLFHEEETDHPSVSFNLIKPRSQCPHCRIDIPYWANIPIVSFILLRGCCRHCRAPISWRYPLLELASGITAVVVALHFGVSWQTASSIVLTWGLLVLGVIDIEHQLLPDDLTLPLLWLGLFCSVFNFYTQSESAIIGAIAGYLILFSIASMYQLCTGKIGMGHGDFKLLALLGAWFGWQLLPFIILFASFLGTLVGLMLIVFGKARRDTPLPFGPYLIIAGWLALLGGQIFNSFYWQWVAFS